MLSPQHQSSEFIPIPANKVGGEHGMRVPKNKTHKSSSPHSPPPMTTFATAMDTTFKIENTVDSKHTQVYPPSNKDKDTSPTIQGHHKQQSRPLNQPR